MAEPTAHNHDLVTCRSGRPTPPTVLLIAVQEHNESVDIWALGVLMYELLVGNPPFDAQGHSATYRRIINVDLVFPPVRALSVLRVGGAHLSMMAPSRVRQPSRSPLVSEFVGLSLVTDFNNCMELLSSSARSCC